MAQHTMPTGSQGQDRKARAAAMLAAARDEYIADARRGAAGAAVLERYAARLDDVVRVIVDEARAMRPLVVCALGGYGRRALALHSDIDLLIAFEGTIGQEEERVAKAILQPLWDLRLTIGQHVREVHDFETPEIDNAEFLLAMLDARRIAGEEPLFSEIVAQLGRTAGDWRPPLIESLFTLVRQRYDQFNQTIYQLEPDIKNAPGGLRDLAVGRHLRALHPRAPGDDTERSARQLHDAEDFLMRLRSILHLESGRDANTLTHELQEKAAELLGCPGDTPQGRVEAMMGEYFRHARVIARTLARTQQLVQPPAERGAPRPVGRHFDVSANGVRFVDPVKAASRPSLWVEIFRVALANGAAVSEQALSIIEQNVERYTADDFVPTEQDRQQLRKLLHPRPGLYARLTEMHDCGLLNQIFPEFAAIHCRVVRDFYHKYTVDEHSLLAVRTIESLWNAETPSRQRFGAILHEVRDPELLTLALLYHDVGKWREADHAVESLRMAHAMLDRLAIAGEPRHLVEFLIRQHLQMSQVAFRRDGEDPQIIGEFAALVGTEEQLKMLCLMTLADVNAVNPDTLTPWKEELLWRVYVESYNRLTLGYADELVEKDEAGLEQLLDERPDDIPEPELRRFLGGLPRRYLALFGPPAIYRHARLARDLRRDEVHAFLEKHDDVWELSVVTLDRPSLFSNVCGVLAYFGMNIHRGQAMTTPDGLVLDVFEFSDDEGFLRKNPGAADDIYAMLNGVVKGSVDVPTLLRGKERSMVYRRRQRFAPVVHFDNAHSRKYTVLEIVATDGPGLLHRISRVISGAGCAVDLVLIATEGKRAVDVLHVTKGGRKLADQDQTALTRDLLTMLEDRHETH